MKKKKINGKRPPRPTKQTIGQLIRQTRKRKGLSAELVAFECNVTTSRLYQWEVANRIIEKNIPALAKALRIPASQLRSVNVKRR
ncbi:helix-turn-helix domain-containing protein [Bradyrhizobium elkanii]|uniref:helix-turn-helix domain-containing protein n=1 Tax=Bradyrhizobium elkanii TaxID=29448 RepID=UPI00042490D4|nr:helix-turn-helix transcriptional regulator [Bradyrhizobium elkanii]